MKKKNNLADTLEKQEQRELLFEVIYKVSVPTIMLIALGVSLWIKFNM